MSKLITLNSKLLSATFNPFGAELCSVKHIETGHEFLWQAANDWPRHAPVLFPFVGRLNEFNYRYDNKVYSIEQHGFARQSMFEVLSITDQEIVFELKNNEYSFQRFPFEFSFKVSYKLNDNILLMGFTIENLCNIDMPVSFGGHPAFNIISPMDAYLEFDKDDELYSFQLKDGLISDSVFLVSEKKGVIELNDSTFSNDALIFKKLKSDYVNLKSKSNTSCVRIGIENWPFLGIWAKPAANFVCIEPWQGIADLIGFKDDVRNKEGIVILPSGKMIFNNFSMDFSI